MFALRAPLLPRLRRHPLLWVLVVAVLLTKLVSASVCAADAQFADAATAQAVVAAAAPTADGDGCLLGETACHCACAETLPIPAAGLPAVVAAMPVFTAPRVSLTAVSTTLESPLRPPIA